MAENEDMKKMQELIDKYNKLLAKRRLIEEERDELEKKAFKMLADSMENLSENEE